MRWSAPRTCTPAITDCGAGGLSSAVGEMAEGVGADVDLDLCRASTPASSRGRSGCPRPRSAWWCRSHPTASTSSRERCGARGVDLADIGEFTGDGRLVVRSGGDVVADLDTAFLHDGRPQRRMTRRCRHARPHGAATGRTVDDPTADAAGPARPSEHRLEGSDHPPLRPRDPRLHRRAAAGRRRADAPGRRRRDRRAGDDRGLAVGIGVNPWYGLHDPEHMAIAVVDEAIRNVVAVGADPDRVALLDNFSWGDPRRPSTLGELVAAVAGCCTAAALTGRRSSPARTR